MELVPCVRCKRHVGVRERACPFCSAVLPIQRPQRAIPGGRLTRAAIFSAALVACESKQAPPKPAPAPAPAQGSDDLEKMLDVDQHVVDHPAPPAAIDAGASPDATAIAATSDAGTTVDAGIDPKVAAERRRKVIETHKRMQEEREKHLKEQHRVETLPIDDMRMHAKPYGAPPARRRVV